MKIIDRAAGLALPLLATLVAAPAAALTITPVWDSSITALANASTVENAFSAVLADYNSALSAPVTVYINVGWGEVRGTALPTNAVGASSSNLYGYFTYAQLKPLLPAGDVLPAATPSGVSRYVVTSAEAKALGIVPATQTNADGYIGFAGSTSSYGFTTGTTTASLYDFRSVAAHEIAEVLGQISGVDSGSYRTPFDLFRYSSKGVLSYNYNSSAYFSLDGGATKLASFNYSTNGGDRGDWATTSTTSDARDAFIGRGQHKSITGVDLAALDATGWGSGYLAQSPAALHGVAFSLVTPGVPEPSSWALLVSGFGLAGTALRRRRLVA